MGEILFLAHRVPWPPNRGDKIRSHHILRKLVELAPVHLACFADDDAEAAESDGLASDLASCQIAVRTKAKWQAGIEALMSGEPVSLTAFHSPELEGFVEKTLRSYPIDCIFIFSGQMAQYIPDDFVGRVIMDFGDVDSAKFDSYGCEGSGPMAWVNRREGRLLRAFEKQIGEQVDRVLFVSQAETDLFQSRSGISPDKISALGNGIDLKFYDPAKAIAIESSCKGPLLVFTGQMDYRPNVEAVTSFATEVMPAIIKHHPDARFAIVGRAPTDEVTKLDGCNGTTVVGAVDDIRSWLKAADVIVAPLRIARGIQNKVLEAMAMHKPVVASAAAAEGIDAVHDEHFLIAQDVIEEAQFVRDLLDNADKAHALGQRAGALIRSRYSWERQLADLPTLCGLDQPEMVEAAE